MAKRPESERPASGARRRRILGIGPRSVSLSITLAVSIGLLVLVAVASSLTVALLASTQNTFSLLADKATLTLDLTEDHLRRHLETVESQLDYLAERLESGQVDADDPAALQTLLLGAAAGTPHVVSLSYWTGTLDDMTVTTVNRGPDGAVTVGQAPAQLEGITRAEVVSSYFRNEPYWGRVVYVEALEGAGLNHRHPVVVDGEIQGMLVAAVTTRELSRAMEELSEADSAAGEAGAIPFILYGRDRVLAHPAYAAPTLAPRIASALAGRDADDPLLGIDEVGSPALARLWEAESDGTSPIELADGSIRFVEIEPEEIGAESGRQRLFLLRTLTGYSDRPLIVGASLPAATVGREMQRLIGSALVGLGILAVSVLIGIFVGRRIARPVIRLANRATQVAETLDFSHVDPLPGSAFTELNRQAGAFNRMVTGMRWLDTYVPKTLVRRLMAKGHADAVQSIQRELTIMFTDIEGFTTRSEGRSAGDTAAFLNRHFGLLTQAVEAEGGTVDKFMGDGMMAFWGAPEKQRDHAERAVRTALAIRAAITADNAERERASHPRVRMRIGIHTGTVVVGNIGAEGRMNYTTVGDAVNTANRLEQHGKQVDRHPSGVTILLSAETAAALPQGRYPLVDLGPQVLRGRAEAVTLYALDGGDAGTPHA